MTIPNFFPGSFGVFILFRIFFRGQFGIPNFFPNYMRKYYENWSKSSVFSRIYIFFSFGKVRILRILFSELIFGISWVGIVRIDPGKKFRIAQILRIKVGNYHPYSENTVRFRDYSALGLPLLVQFLNFIRKKFPNFIQKKIQNYIWEKFPNYIWKKSPNYIWKKFSELHSDKNSV
jgi:hypothetical protein